MPSDQASVQFAERADLERPSTFDGQVHRRIKAHRIFARERITKAIDEIEHWHVSKHPNQGSNQRNNEEPGDPAEQLFSDPAVVTFAEVVTESGDGSARARGRSRCSSRCHNRGPGSFLMIGSQPASRTRARDSSLCPACSASPAFPELFRRAGRSFRRTTCGCLQS